MSWAAPLRWLLRRPLARAEDKYFTGKRSGALFQVYKSYRLLLFQKCPEASPWLQKEILEEPKQAR